MTFSKLTKHSQNWESYSFESELNLSGRAEL